MAETTQAVAVPTHTDDARELLAAGIIQPGSKALDVPVESMSDREILQEMLIHSRNTRDAVTALVEGINNSPIGRMIAGGTLPGPLGGMFGGSTGGDS